MFLGIFELIGSAFERPFPPRRYDRDVRLQGIIGELIAHLVIALSRRAVSDRIGAGPFGNFNLLLGNERPRDRRAEEIDAFIERIGAKHREDEVAHEFLAQILDEDILRLDAVRGGFAAGRLKLLALPQIGREGNDFSPISLLKPFEND